MIGDIKRCLGATGSSIALVTGVARIDPSGAFCFSGQDVATQFLSTIRRWVQEEGIDKPALQRLIGARYLQLTSQGEVISTFQNDAMWQRMLPMLPLHVEMQLRLTTAVLRDARVGEQLLFWLAPRCVEQHTMLVIRPNRGPEDVARFQKAVLRVQGRTRRAETFCSGFVEVEPQGRLHFYTQSPRNILSRIAGLVKSYLGLHPALVRLCDAQQSSLNENGATVQSFADPSLWEGIPREQLAASGDVLLKLREVLEASAPGEKYLFDFAAAGPTGTPLLVLTPAVGDSKQIHAQTRQVLTGGARPLSAKISGFARSRRDGKAGLDFRSKTDAADFLPALADFVKNNASREPALNRLAHSVFSLVGEDRQPIRRMKDDALWA
ncbi:MAG: hypothetical protein AAFV53_31705 [Myxococcota bacterium]